MANKPCACGSEPIPGTAPEVVLYLSDLYKGNFSIGNILPIARSPIFLSLASDFCRVSPKSNYFGSKSYSAYLFAKAIDSLWAKKCRCKPDGDVYSMWYFFRYFIEGGTRDASFSTGGNTIGVTTGIRVETTQEAGSVVRVRTFGWIRRNNYASEVLLQNYARSLAPGNSFSFDRVEQSKISSGTCPPTATPSPSPPSPIAYPSIPRSPVPYEPPSFYIPKIPARKRIGLPPKPLIDDCCDCC